MKPCMEYARAHQKHQDLIVGDSRALVHGLQAVQKAYDFLLIEVRDGGEHRAAKRVLHERTRYIRTSSPQVGALDGDIWLLRDVM